jgi:hypothetical protein
VHSVILFAHLCSLHAINVAFSFIIFLKIILILESLASHFISAFFRSTRRLSLPSSSVPPNSRLGSRFLCGKISKKTPNQCDLVSRQIRVSAVDNTVDMRSNFCVFVSVVTSPFYSSSLVSVNIFLQESTPDDSTCSISLLIDPVLFSMQYCLS